MARGEARVSGGVERVAEPHDCKKVTGKEGSYYEGQGQQTIWREKDETNHNAKQIYEPINQERISNNTSKGTT